MLPRPEENTELLEKHNAFKFEVETELSKLSSRFEFYEAELKKRDEEIKVLKQDLKQNREENIVSKQEIEKLKKQVLGPRRTLELEFLDAIERGLVESIIDYRKKGVLWSVNDEGQNALHLALANPDMDLAYRLANKLLENEKKSEFKRSNVQLYHMHDLHGLLPVQQVAKYKGKIPLIKYLYEVGELTTNQDLFDSIFDSACNEVADYLVNRKLLESAKQQKDNDEKEEYAEGHVEGVKDALAKRANINVQADTGETALANAVYYKYMEVTRVLLAAGADPTIKNNNGSSPLDAIIKSTNARDIEFKKLIAPSFLLFAAQHGHLSDMQKALFAGADLLTADAKGKTALHKVVRSGNKEAINFLLQKYAEAKIDISIKDKKGKIPTDYLDNMMIKRKSGQEVELRSYIHERYGVYIAKVSQIEQDIKSAKSLPILSNFKNSFVANLSNQSNSMSAIPCNNIYYR